MPCSCKAKKNTVSIKTANNTVKVSIPQYHNQQQTVNDIPSILQKVSTSSFVSSDSISYDFSSTTLPTELCYNCIRKHLSIAYTLLQEDSDSLTAYGQVLCASLHLINVNKDLKDVMQNRVLQAIRGNKDLLIEDLLNWIKNIETIKDKADPINPTPIQQNLMCLMLSYGLLFVQISYEELNKSWATAELFRGAIKKFHSDRNFQQFQNVRRIWKLIQSMMLYDQTYEDARKELKQELQLQWKKYKQGNIIV